jgi:hypothetical protein
MTAVDEGDGIRVRGPMLRTLRLHPQDRAIWARENDVIRRTAHREVDFPESSTLQVMKQQHTGTGARRGS